MKISNRRNFFRLGGAAAAAALLTPRSFASEPAARPGVRRATPMIHATDLYHLHDDPDDHWDLATVYALAFRQHVNLRGVLIDYPSRREREPDVMAVAQMNYYTGLVVPAVVGSPEQMKSRNDSRTTATPVSRPGADWLLRELRTSPDPVVVNIVGYANDVALATVREPALFRDKCRGIYLNAGTARVGPRKPGRKFEWNAGRNPHAYAAIFDAPCPIYWLPPKNEWDEHAVAEGANASYYGFLQGDILPHLSRKLQNFFLFMLGRKVSHSWFNYLRGEPEQALLAEFSSELRSMWCTAGFLHAAGLKVTGGGAIVPLEDHAAAVCSFRPVEVQCDDRGNTTWSPAQRATNRFILQIDDRANYQPAMTLALKNLLLQLPA